MRRDESRYLVSFRKTSGPVALLETTFGQYWSKEFYKNIIWNASDAFQCGRVLVVRNAAFTDLDDPKLMAGLNT